MKIVLFARILGSTRLCKILQESSLLSNFGSLPKIRNARFGRSRPLGAKQPSLYHCSRGSTGSPLVRNPPTLTNCCMYKNWLAASRKTSQDKLHSPITITQGTYDYTLLQNRQECLNSSNQKYLLNPRTIKPFQTLQID